MGVFITVAAVAGLAVFVITFLVGDGELVFLVVMLGVLAGVASKHYPDLHVTFASAFAVGVVAWGVLINNGAGCLSEPGYTSLLAHELGHGLGFGHVADRNNAISKVGSRRCWGVILLKSSPEIATILPSRAKNIASRSPNVLRAGKRSVPTKR